ncbi:hypothetical protein K7G98_06680, partial [Saccharothrix sp. MB29]|nr:hypothetical protein [Saccharothrix sp. MB29]
SPVRTPVESGVFWAGPFWTGGMGVIDTGTGPFSAASGVAVPSGSDPGEVVAGSPDSGSVGATSGCGGSGASNVIGNELGRALAGGGHLTPGTGPDLAPPPVDTAPDANDGDDSDGDRTAGASPEVGPLGGPRVPDLIGAAPSPPPPGGGDGRDGPDDPPPSDDPDIGPAVPDFTDGGVGNPSPTRPDAEPVPRIGDRGTGAQDDPTRSAAGPGDRDR